MAASTAGAPGALVFANLGLVSMGLEDYPRAIEEYTAIGALEVDGLVNRGLAYDRLGEVDLARADYRAALATAPDDVAALINLGTLEFAEGAVEVAQELLERASALDPQAGWQLSDVLRHDGDLDAAAEALQAAIRAGEPRAYLDLADVEEERGNSEASRAAYDAAAAAGLVDETDDSHGVR
ncbi:MAG: tetratricopeptide repeat protein [Microbacterium sp.]|nr:tetratricopeptide repeat protein [Microbacterium sp.]